MPLKTLTRDEVAENNTEESLWFVINSKVYDVTDFLDVHPGGEAVLKQGRPTGIPTTCLDRPQLMIS
ncbi:acyl-CoA dehydrogenase domain-containing protein [Diplocarpon rosae]|nr:acyl-CoA dehydrogenase domain-containing protein [Diplocarpon rosae]